MKIKRLTLHGFGVFNNGTELAFSEDSVNVVAGDNEAGKSTLVAAIYGILFGFASAEEERSHHPWAECEAYAGEIEIQAGAGVFRVSRDFATNDSVIAKLEAGLEQEVFSGDANPRGRGGRGYAKALQAAFGVSSGRVASSTSIVRQLDMRTEIDAELKRLLSGARGGDFQQVLGTLQNRHSGLTRENPWGVRDRSKDRAIELAEAKLEDLQSRRDDLARHLKQTAGLELQIEAQRATALETAQSRSNDERLLDNLDRLTEQQRRRKALQESIADIRQEKAKISHAKDRLNEIARERTANFKGFDELADDFPDRLGALAAARAELESCVTA